MIRTFKNAAFTAARALMAAIMPSVMRFWLNRHVDGFRVDLADSLVKNDDNKEATIEIWQHMISTIKKEY